MASATVSHLVWNPPPRVRRIALTDRDRNEGMGVPLGQLVLAMVVLLDRGVVGAKLVLHRVHLLPEQPAQRVAAKKKHIK